MKDGILKLDLHVHLYEATGLRPLTRELLGQVLTIVKARGLDGIAVTDHLDAEYAYRVKEMMEHYFPNQLLIIPGQELYRAMWHEIELYLPNGSTFRFLAHPGYPYHPYWRDYPGQFPDPATVANVQGVEIENAWNNAVINKELVKEIAEKHRLLLLRNSDAHYLDWVGQCYNEIALEELIARAK